MGHTKVVFISVLSLFLGGAIGYGVFNAVHLPTAENTVNLSKNDQNCSLTSQSDQPTVLFSLDGKNYTQDTIPNNLKDSIYTMESKNYDMLSSYIKEFALRLALSKNSSKQSDVNNLPSLFDLLPIKPITEKELKKFYQDSKSQIPQNVTYEMAKPQLERYLKNKKVAELFSAETDKLEKSGRLKILKAPPVAPVVSLNWDAFPSFGKKDAPHVLVEASDYKCGHCQKIQPEVKALLESMPEKIKFVQINFALDPNGESGALIRGAFCARKLGGDESFWKYHHAAFSEASNEKHDHQAHEQKTSESLLEKPRLVAKTVSLDLKKFNSCISSAEAKKHVENTVKMLTEAGVSGTPTFFLDNRKFQVGHNGLIAELKDKIKNL